VFHKSPGHHHFVASKGLLVAASNKLGSAVQDPPLSFPSLFEAAVNGNRDCFMTLLPVIVMFGEIYSHGGDATVVLFYLVAYIDRR
jgi:hypothetical protein